MCSQHHPQSEAAEPDQAEWLTQPPLPAWTPDLRLTQLPRTLLMGVIRLYQLTLSRALPANTCRFYPSCSRYGFEAIQKYGALRGSVMAAWRVLRCNPFNPGGYDPVP